MSKLLSRRAVPGIMLGLCLLLTSALTPLPVASAGPITIPQGPLPTDELRPVELSFLSIEGTVASAGDATVISFRTRTRLHNPERRASFERPVTFAGLPVSDVRVGTQNGGVAPVSGTGPWLLRLPADGDAIIEGTQSLSATGPVIDLQFDWEALAPWGTSLAAVRLTLRFPEGLDSEQLLLVSPAPTEHSVQSLSWSYERHRPAGLVRVQFIAPSVWQPVRVARQAASAHQAGAGEHLALAAALRPIVGAEGMPHALATVLLTEQQAALQLAVSAAPQDSRAHQELATYLRAQANGDPGLLAQAVSAYKAAYDLAPADAELRRRLLAAIDELVAACRQSGDTPGLLRALDLAQAIDPQNSRVRAAAYADAAVSLLEAGRQAEAEAIIVAGFGPAALERYDYLRPRFRSVTGDVETSMGQRAMRFVLVPATGMEQAAEHAVAGLVQAMARAPGHRVKHTLHDGQNHIEVIVPFDGSEGLRSTGQALAGALPPDADPALQLIAAVAAPILVEFEGRRDLHGDSLTYRETANLTPAQDGLQQRLEKLRFARSEAEAASADPVEAARRRWALALLSRYEADWQALVRGCRVTYRLFPPDDLLAPQWALAWGERRSLSWRANLPRLERLLPYGIGLASALLVAVALLGLVGRRK